MNPKDFVVSDGDGEYDGSKHATKQSDLHDLLPRLGDVGAPRDSVVKT